MNPLPPQAYTRDTLMKAYQWLQSQPPHIRALATSNDLAVSLYTKAQMQGEEALDRPVIQNFKHELKNIAGMMGEFEILETPTGAIATTKNTPPANGNTNPSPRTVGPVVGPAAAEKKWDAQTQQMIEKVKKSFNLTNDDETCRLMMSTGFHRLMSLIKKDTMES